MSKFRKKPVIVDAVQWNGKNIDEILSFASSSTYRDSNIYIQTLEGEMLANQSDWIIKGVNGEFYPCKSDIFEKTYDPVVEKTLAECLNLKLKDM